MELKYLIIIVLFLLGVRMFSIAIPALKRGFERIKELKKQLREEREKEQLEYKKVLEDSTKPVFGNPDTFKYRGIRNALIENIICLDDIDEDIKPTKKFKRWIEEPIKKGEPLTKALCEICEKPLLEEDEIKNHLCNDCYDDDESDVIFTEESRNHVRTGDKNLRDHYDWLDDLDEDEETYEGSM